uniref:Uncharacterized protein n=1 Tax=Setaria digitata TaxID=48799 RepID=A0A915PVP9_9BILA
MISRSAGEQALRVRVQKTEDVKVEPREMDYRGAVLSERDCMSAVAPGSNATRTSKRFEEEGRRVTRRSGALSVCRTAVTAIPARLTDEAEEGRAMQHAVFFASSTTSYS